MYIGKIRTTLGIKWLRAFRPKTLVRLLSKVTMIKMCRGERLVYIRKLHVVNKMIGWHNHAN